MARGSLITIEGLDGAGKSTLAAALAEAIAARGLRVALQYRQGATMGDPWQLGGALLVRPDGEVRWRFVSQSPELSSSS